MSALACIIIVYLSYENLRLYDLTEEMQDAAELTDRGVVFSNVQFIRMQREHYVMKRVLKSVVEVVWEHKGIRKRWSDDMHIQDTSRQHKKRLEIDHHSMSCPNLVSPL